VLQPSPLKRNFGPRLQPEGEFEKRRKTPLAWLRKEGWVQNLLAKLQGHSSMIRKDPKMYLVRVQDTQAKPHIVYPELRTKKIMLVPVESWNNHRLNVQSWLVVATTLQAWHPSFRFRTLTNKTSVETSIIVGFSGQFQQKWCFPSCNSWLEKHLGEPAQF
jgi:hypothetical protein